MPRLSRTTLWTVLTGRPAQAILAALGALGAGAIWFASTTADVTAVFSRPQNGVAPASGLETSKEQAATYTSRSVSAPESVKAKSDILTPPKKDVAAPPATGLNAQNSNEVDDPMNSRGCLTEKQLTDILDLLKQKVLSPTEALILSRSLKCRYLEVNFDGKALGSGYSLNTAQNALFDRTVIALSISPDLQVRRSFEEAVKNDFNLTSLEKLRSAVTQQQVSAAGGGEQVDAKDVEELSNILASWGVTVSLDGHPNIATAAVANGACASTRVGTVGKADKC